jgi:hypothetical protein
VSGEVTGLCSGNRKRCLLALNLVVAIGHVSPRTSNLKPGTCSTADRFNQELQVVFLLTSCLPFTLRSATVRDSGYISERVFSVASAVTCVSGELKSAGNVLTGGQRVC